MARLIDADAIQYTHAIARSIEDGHNWNELCVTKDDIDAAPTVPAISVEWLEWRIMNAKYNGIKEAADAFEFVLKCWEEEEAKQ